MGPSRDRFVLRWGVSIGLAAAAARAFQFVLIAQGNSVTNDGYLILERAGEIEIYIGLALFLLGGLFAGWRLNDAGWATLSMCLAGTTWGIAQIVFGLILLFAYPPGFSEFDNYFQALRYPPDASYGYVLLMASPFIVFVLLSSFLAGFLLGLVGGVLGWLTRRGLALTTRLARRMRSAEAP